MRPNLIVDNKADRLLANAKLNRQSFLENASAPQSANFRDFGFRQFSYPSCASTGNIIGAQPCPMSFTDGHSSPLFGIVAVTFVVTFKQMLWITTRRIVTMVKNQLCGPFTLRKKEGQTGRSAMPFKPPQSNDTIAILVSFLLPFPAVTIRALTKRCINGLPKATNFYLDKLGWYRIKVTHVLESISFQNVAGLWGVNSVPQAAL